MSQKPKQPPPLLTTAVACDRTLARLQMVYTHTRFELMTQSDATLVEMIHEADEYKAHASFSARTAGEIVSVCCQLVLDERRQKRAQERTIIT